jgi:hypothetical protein
VDAQGFAHLDAVLQFSVGLVDLHLDWVPHICWLLVDEEKEELIGRRVEGKGGRVRRGQEE